MDDIPNWTAVEDKARVWQNTKTETRIWVVYNDIDDQWELCGTDGHNVIDTADSKDEAEEIAYDFMCDNPAPTA